MRLEALRKGHQASPATHSNPASKLLSSVSAACGKIYSTNEERIIYQRKAWNLAAKHQGADVFVTLTPNENGNATIAFFSGQITQKSLYQVQHSEIPSSAKIVQISGCDPFACELFFN